MTETVDMPALIARLCEYHGVVDQAALMETEAFKVAYSKEHARAPNVSYKSLMGKALKAMKDIQQPNVDLQAHCIEPRYEHITFEREEGKKGGKFVTDSLGILVATPDGESKYVKMAAFDPLTPVAQQFANLGIPAGLSRGSPITLRGVNTYRDLLEDTTRVEVTKESTVVAGGHALPFPEGPDLERVIGATAMQKRQGAWKLNKATGCIQGSFGDTKGDPRAAVLTVTSDKSAIAVRAFEDDPPEKHHVFAPCYDRQSRNGVGIKFRYDDVLEQFGLDSGVAREVIQAKLAGQRVLVRGTGSIYMPKSPEDFGEEGKVFDARIKELTEEGYMVGYGDKGNVRLSLIEKYVLDENGQRLPQTSVRIGDKDVYAIMQKGAGTDRESWDISVLAADEQKLPWMSCYSKSGTFTNKDGQEEGWDYARNAFVLFLEGVHGGAELREDDPFLKAVENLPVPSFIQKLQQQTIQSTPPQPAAAAPVANHIPPPGSRLINGPAKAR